MENEPISNEALRVLKHDIKNQLSNIHLAVETIIFEVNDPSEDFNFCIKTIMSGASKIDALLKNLP